nr:putative ribonuclease H-like domain-containing protein [Tanacetum cinerariifolium]
IGPKWVFNIDTLTKSMNYQLVVAGNKPNDNAGIKENLDAENKHDVHVFANKSDKSDNKKHDEKAKRDDKGKSLVASHIGVRDLRAEFKEFSFNSTNRVNTVSEPVNAAGPNLTNSTNSFNTASPTVNTVSSNFRIAVKFSFMDHSKYPDDLDMPELEDIVYLDDKVDAGAEADLSNLNKYTSPQTKSMTMMVKEQGGLHQINNEDFHTYLDYPDKAYKVVKALYGLHQAPRAWYETLANNLLENGFQRGKIDQTLFIKKQKRDILLVQVYVDDIIFGSTNKELCKAFEKLMKDKFQMSSMGELNFFLGLQVKQKDDEIFISQDKYVAEILRKYELMLFGLTKDAAVNLILLGFDQMVDFLNAHTIQYALVVNPTIYVSCIKQFFATATINKVNDAVYLRALIDGKKVVVSKDVIRIDLHLDDADGVECLRTEEIFAELARMGYEKPPPKQTFYKATAWNEFSCSMASAIICLATDPTPTPHATSPQDQPSTPPALPPQEQPTTTSKSFMSLMTTLMEMRMHPNWGKIEVIDADEDITLVDVETQEDVVIMDAEPQGRINQDVDVNADSKGVSAAEPTVFDDEEEQETHLENNRKCQSLKKKPVLVAQARKNMIIFLKNMAGYKMEQFKGMTYDKVRPIFEREYKKVQTLFKPDKDAQEPKKKIVAEATLLLKRFKKLKVIEVSVEALQVKHPIIDWEIHTEGSRTYWKIIRVGGITEAYQSFEDMLKGFDKEDLAALWNLVKEKFSSAVHKEDKEKALWVELKRLFEPDAGDVFWKLQRYMHDPLTWNLYTNCGVHHVSLTRRHDIFMLTEKDYPLSNGVMILMLSGKLQVKEDSEMARDLVIKIFMEANKLKSKILHSRDLKDIDLRFIEFIVTKDEGNDGSDFILGGCYRVIVMVNVIPPDHVDEVPAVELNQHDDVHVVPEPVLEDENKPELTYPHKEVDPLNPSPPAFESEPNDEIKVENPIKHEDETVPASVHEVVRSSVEQGTTATEKLVEKLGNTKDKVECKKLKKELKESRFSNTFVRMQNERVERDLYWTRVLAHKSYQEMIHRGFMFIERPNEANNVLIGDEKSPSFEPRESP